MWLKRTQYRLGIILKPLFRRLGSLDINWGYYLATFLAIIIIFLLGSSIFRIIRKGYERYQIIQEEKQRLDDLRAQNSQLEEDLKYYSSKEYVDIKAREELNLGFPNQKLVYYVKPETFYGGEGQEEEKPLKASWKLWYNLIF